MYPDMYPDINVRIVIEMGNLIDMLFKILQNNKI